MNRSPRIAQLQQLENDLAFYYVRQRGWQAGGSILSVPGDSGAEIMNRESLALRISGIYFKKYTLKQSTISYI